MTPLLTEDFPAAVFALIVGLLLANVWLGWRKR